MALTAPLASPVYNAPASNAGASSTRGISVTHAAPPHKVLAINRVGGPWLDYHFPGGSSAFLAQLLGQIMPAESLVQPVIIQKMHASYAALLTPYGSEASVFFSPYALDKDRPIDLYT
ncbi:hypothetical protein TMES_12090 [Thalassospira mesophila]|uniref:Uncharacterized protein n=1 Tax=Thalassospira mesophila TaxID=1293891 RepID=A0A1Y2L086_9PROT|nr:hypothetical protein TMES_12090 [Thalassospira mesophila]